MTADRTAAGMIGAGPKSNRANHDYYATPPVCTEALLRIEPQLLDAHIVEPCCGEGHISKVLKQHGCRVSSSDLIDRGYGRTGVDFLRMHKLQGDVVASNPPFSHAAEFVRHALALDARSVVMLLKLQFLETADRSDLIEDCWLQHRASLQRVHVFKNRVALWKNGKPHKGGMFALGWFVWSRARQAHPHIHRVEVR